MAPNFAGYKNMPPSMRATLDTLSWAEGTWDEKAGAPNYRARFGDRKGTPGTLDISKPHPLTVVRSPWGANSLSSNASGAYQFMSDTWSEMNDNSNAVMSPYNQDQAAARLLTQIGYDPAKDFTSQLPTLANRWASFPNERGVSNYNQPVKSAKELTDFYNNRLTIRRGGIPRLAGSAGIQQRPQIDLGNINLNASGGI